MLYQFLNDLKRTVFAVIGTVLLPACAAWAQPIFTDNFTPGPSRLWNNLRGDWVGTNSVYYALQPNNNPLTYTAVPFNMTDCSIDVDINAVADGGVWLRTDETGENGILLVTGGNGWGLGTRGNGAGTSMYWHQVINGQYSGKLNETFNVITNPGVQRIHLRAQVTGNTYVAFVDGGSNAVTTFVDSTYVSGRIALYDFSSQTFSNVVIAVPASQAHGSFMLGSATVSSLQATISWPTNANGLFLESTPGLVGLNWALVTNRPIVSNQQFTVTIPLTNGRQFFRLSLR